MGSDRYMEERMRSTERYRPLLNQVRRLAKDFEAKAALVIDPGAKDAWRAAGKALMAIVKEETKHDG